MKKTVVVGPYPQDGMIREHDLGYMLNMLWRSIWNGSKEGLNYQANYVALPDGGIFGMVAPEKVLKRTSRTYIPVVLWYKPTTLVPMAYMSLWSSPSDMGETMPVGGDYVVIPEWWPKNTHHYPIHGFIAVADFNSYYKRGDDPNSRLRACVGLMHQPTYQKANVNLLFPQIV